MARPTRIGVPVEVRGRAGNRIACQVAGPREAPPVVLTSGIGCGPVFYRHIAPELARDHRVIYWDYRAHGESGPAPDGRAYAIEHHAADLEDVVQTLTRRPPVMVGFSMGVQVTVEWARRWGDTAPAYVFLLGMPCNPLRSHWALGRPGFHAAARLFLNAGPGAALPALHPATKVTLRSRMSYAIARRSGLISGAFAREDYEEFIRYSSAVRPDAYLRCAVGVIEHDAVDCWRELSAPTLYLAAEHDVLVPARECSDVAPLLHAGEYDQLDGRTHAGTVEAARGLAARVRDFVEARLAEQEHLRPSTSPPSSGPRPHERGARGRLAGRRRGAGIVALRAAGLDVSGS